MDQYYQVILILITLICSAFFSGSEIAFLQSNKLAIEIDRKQGNFSARILSFFIKKQNSFITTLLLGNNIALVLYGIFMGDLITNMLFPAYVDPISGSTLENIPYYVLLVQTLISTLIILITAEFLPKTIFRINPNKILSFISTPLLLFYIFLFPLTLIVTYLSNLILSMFGSKNDMEDMNFGLLDLDDYLNKKAKSNQNEEDEDYEVQIFHNALNFSKVKARDCMIPRTELTALDIDTPIDELLNTFIETGFSKILIFRDSIDNIIGYVHSFEMFKKPTLIREIIRPVAIVPESIPANAILEKFISKKQAISIVVDEFGGTAGLITMEDVVEEIFGEIQDEHDSEDLVEEIKNKNEFIFSARHEIEYLNAEFDLQLPLSDEYETLAGLIVTHFEDIPDEKEVIEIGQYTFTILESSNSKIETIQLNKN